MYISYTLYYIILVYYILFYFILLYIIYYILYIIYYIIYYIILYYLILYDIISYHIILYIYTIVHNPYVYTLITHVIRYVNLPKWTSYISLVPPPVATLQTGKCSQNRPTSTRALVAASNSQTQHLLALLVHSEKRSAL